MLLHLWQGGMQMLRPEVQGGLSSYIHMYVQYTNHRNHVRSSSIRIPTWFRWFWDGCQRPKLRRPFPCITKLWESVYESRCVSCMWYKKSEGCTRKKSRKSFLPWRFRSPTSISSSPWLYIPWYFLLKFSSISAPFSVWNFSCLGILTFTGFKDIPLYITRS